jgi:tripartite ATP-independent transporter DctP family solute receptor
MNRVRVGRRHALRTLAGASLGCTLSGLAAAAVTARSPGGSPEATAVTWLRAADVQPPDYPTSQALEFMGRELERISSGRLGIKLFTGGRLGDEADTLEITILGGIDINRVNLAPLNSIEPLTQVLALPFLFRSTRHLHAAVDGPVGQEILASLQRHGLVGLAFYDSGARSFYNSRRPIRSLADMRGLKLRVQNSELAIAMVRSLGANATPMGFGQVFESLILGTIDGSENNFPSYRTARHFEAARYLTRTEHTMAPEVVVMSLHRWQRLSPTEQDWVSEAARMSVPYMRTLWAERESTALAELRAADVEVIEDFDRAAFEAAVQPLYRRWLSEPRFRRLVDSIRAEAA